MTHTFVDSFSLPEMDIHTMTTRHELLIAELRRRERATAQTSPRDFTARYKNRNELDEQFHRVGRHTARRPSRPETSCRPRALK